MIRKVRYPISEIFINRWSSRAISEKHISHDELMTLFEAARWAPSGYNEQPWRFIYTRKGAVLYEFLLNSMIPFNKNWAKNADVLVVIISKTFFDRTNKKSHLNSFDAGSAWMSLALQGSINGLVIHAIGDFDYEAVRSFMQIPDDFKLEIIVAVGKKGPKDILPPELQVRETPNDRKALEDIVFKDIFKKND